MPDDNPRVTPESSPGPPLRGAEVSSLSDGTQGLLRLDDDATVGQGHGTARGQGLEFERQGLASDAEHHREGLVGDGDHLPGSRLGSGIAAYQPGDWRRSLLVTAFVLTLSATVVTGSALSITGATDDLKYGNPETWLFLSDLFMPVRAVIEGLP